MGSGRRFDDLLAEGMALDVEHGCEVVTLDRDVARFSAVRHHRPSVS